jgi:hypothetical protein
LLVLRRTHRIEDVICGELVRQYLLVIGHFPSFVRQHQRH